jgi:hypothetical protein
VPMPFAAGGVALGCRGVRAGRFWSARCGSHRKVTPAIACRFNRGYCHTSMVPSTAAVPIRFATGDCTHTFWVTPR